MELEFRRLRLIKDEEYECYHCQVAIMDMANVFFILITSIFLNVFFLIGHVIMHIMVIGIPCAFIGILMLNIMLHWRIIANGESIIIVHNFRKKQKIAVTLIDKVVIRREIMTNLAEDEGIYIYLKGQKHKKIINIDQTYVEYNSFKGFLLENHVTITIS